MKSKTAQMKTKGSAKKSVAPRKVVAKKQTVKATVKKVSTPTTTGPKASVKKVPAEKARAATVKKAAAASRKPSTKSKASSSRKQVVTKTLATSKKPVSPAPANPVRLNARQKEKFKNLLLTMRERLSASIRSLKNESLATKDWVNLEEDGTDIFDQQFALNIVSSENEMLIQIDEALSRLEANEYGLCEACGCVINQERLKALPFAKTCIACQSQKENHGRFKADSLMDGFE